VGGVGAAVAVPAAARWAGTAAAGYGGGYIMFYCEFEKKHKVASHLRKMPAIPTAFEEYGLQAWRTDDSRPK